jgi:tetratricopeptide (TPR) repeat protein
MNLGLAWDRRSGRKDFRLLGLLLVAITVTALGYLVSRLPGRGVEAQAPPPIARHGAIKPDLQPFAGIPDSPAAVEREEAAAAQTPTASEEEQARKALRLAARKALAERNFLAAIELLKELIKRTPKEAQPYLLMGLALEGAGNLKLARQYYEAAIDRDPQMADAYFGYATTSEGLGELDAALGGMRSFLHVQRDADPYRLRVAQARSAIWEWESQLGRGPWGPTKGVPPGFTAEEIRRDGRGVGTKMPIPGTEQADGSQRYEIKHSDKIPMFKR